MYNIFYCYHEKLQFPFSSDVENDIIKGQSKEYFKSNYEVLDQEAIKMIERSKPLPMPTNLTSETFTVFIPIKFGLR